MMSGLGTGGQPSYQHLYTRPISIQRKCDISTTFQLNQNDMRRPGPYEPPNHRTLVFNLKSSTFLNF